MMTAGDHVKLAMSRLPGLQELEAMTLFTSTLRKLYSKYKWKFLIVEQLLSTEASYNDGTVAVTAGSPAVVGTGTAWSAGWDRRKIVIGGRSEVYEFDPTGAGTGNLQINGQNVNWPGDTDSGLSYRIFRDVYALSTIIDWGRDYFWWDPARQTELPMIDRYAMMGLRAAGKFGMVGTPDAVTRGSLLQASETDVPVASVEFGPYAPDAVYTYNFVGFRKATAPTQDGAYPLWPEEFEDVITGMMEVDYADNPRHPMRLSQTRRQEIMGRLWECEKRNDGGAEIHRIRQTFRGIPGDRPFSNVTIYPAAAGGSSEWGS